MRTHTFIANSANEAVEQIRAELGPTAVVVSVRKLPRSGLSRLVKQDQIEVVATVEERKEPQNPPQEDCISGLQAEVQALKQQFNALRMAQSAVTMGASQSVASGEMARILTESGILPVFCERLVNELPSGASQIEFAKSLLRSKWRKGGESRSAPVRLFVGAPGSGKSTVLCKMLAQTSLLERQPATIYQLDAHIANCSGQPSLFSEITGAQFERTLPQTFERGEENVFIDVPGVALGDEKGLGAIRRISRAFGVPEIHLVLNGAYESNLQLEQVRFFASLGITDLIVTHLDEEKRWGKVWNLVLGTNYSVRLLSCGQNVPGDLLPGSPDLLLGRQFCRI